MTKTPTALRGIADTAFRPLCHLAAINAIDGRYLVFVAARPVHAAADTEIWYFVGSYDDATHAEDQVTTWLHRGRVASFADTAPLTRMAVAYDNRAYALIECDTPTAWRAYFFTPGKRNDAWASSPGQDVAEAIREAHRHVLEVNTSSAVTPVQLDAETHAHGVSQPAVFGASRLPGTDTPEDVVETGPQEIPVAEYATVDLTLRATELAESIIASGAVIVAPSDGDSYGVLLNNLASGLLRDTPEQRTGGWLLNNLLDEVFARNQISEAVLVRLHQMYWERLDRGDGEAQHYQSLRAVIASPAGISPKVFTFIVEEILGLRISGLAVDTHERETGVHRVYSTSTLIDQLIGGVDISKLQTY